MCLEFYFNVEQVWDSVCYDFSEVVGEGLSDKNLWLASLGEHLQGEEDGTEQIIDIVEIVKHPGFTCRCAERFVLAL